MATQVDDKAASNDSKLTKANDVDGTEAESPTKKSKLDENTSGKKTSARKKRSDADMIAEAKALYGELDTSGGRSLRRRSEPKPVEEKKKATPKRVSKKKDAEKESEKETNVEANDKTEENNGKDEENGKDSEESKDIKADEEKLQNSDEKSDEKQKTTEDKEKHKEDTKTD